MNNSIFSKLAPNEPKFFPLLNQVADNIVKVTNLITDCVSNYSYDSAKEYFRQIKDLERECDEISNTIFEELNTTFITPFDREDIHDLAYKLDDVVDYINRCIKRIFIYHPVKLHSSSIKLCNLLQEAAKYIHQAVHSLHDLRKEAKSTAECCSKLHDVENAADDIYENLIIDLFENEKDAVELIKLKEITHSLENATDAAEDVGKIIKTIIVKYA